MCLRTLSTVEHWKGHNLGILYTIDRPSPDSGVDATATLTVHFETLYTAVEEEFAKEVKQEVLLKQLSSFRFVVA